MHSTAPQSSSVVELQTRVAAHPSKVWHHWTAPGEIQQWNAASDDWHCPAATNHLQVGASFTYRMEARDGSMGFDLSGTYTEIRPHQFLAFHLDDGRKVRVSFEPDGAGTLVRESFEPESQHPVEMQRAGWQSILDRFKRHVESSPGHAGKISPCLWFDGQAEAAAAFYVDLLPGSYIERITRSPAETPGGLQEGGVLMVEFILAGQSYLALNGGPEFKFNEAVSFQIHCDDQAEVDRLWSALTEGGQELQCSWLRDRWGLSWQIVPRRLAELLQDPNPDRARRAMQAMMKMVKIDIATLEAAAAGE